MNITNPAIRTTKGQARQPMELTFDVSSANHAVRGAGMMMSASNLEHQWPMERPSVKVVRTAGISGHPENENFIT
jgi:hypothetical protein